MNSKQFLKEGFLEDAQEAHSDHEVQMARVDCYYAAEHAIVLHKLLRNISEEQGLEGWVASKITLANDYLKSVREHLEYQMMNVDAGEDDFLPLAEGLKPVKKNSVVESTAPGAEDEEEKFQDFERGPWYVILKGKAISVNGVPKKFNWLNGAKTYFRSMMDKNPEMAQKIKREYDEASDKKSVIYYTKNLPADNTTSTEQPVSEGEKPGLWANIRAKRKRIKGGSGERMRKPGSKGAPSDADIKSIRAASESVVKESDFHSQFAAMIDDMKKSGKLKTGDPTKSQAKYAPEQSREELTARLRELESKFDPEYQYSDDYSFWTKQNAIAREIASIKKKLGSQGVAEGSLEEVDRRGFLKGAGAAAVAGAAGYKLGQPDTSKYKNPKVVFLIGYLHAAKRYMPQDEDTLEINTIVEDYLNSTNGNAMGLYSGSGRFFSDVGIYNEQNNIGEPGYTQVFPNDTKQKKWITSQGKAALRQLKTLLQQSNESVQQGVAEDLADDLAKYARWQAAVGGAVGLGIGAANYADDQRPKIEIGGQQAYYVQNPDWGKVPYNAMTLTGKDGKEYKVWTVKAGGGKVWYATPAEKVKEGVAEGSESDLVYISTDRVEAFEDWMESEGLETDVPKRDEGTYVVYDYSDANHTSKMYADEWNEKKGVAEGYEGDDRGDYHSTARAANQASRTAKSKEDHKKAADLHSKAATYGLSAGQDQSVIRDHQMAASEHHRASKKLKEKSQDVAEGWEDEFRARQAAEKAAKSAQEKEYRQYGITARKSGGDDAYSWAVFINGHMMVNGLSKREVLYYKKIALEKAKEKQGVAEGLPGSSQIYDQIESLREKLNSTSDPDERRFYIKKIKNLEHKLHSTDDPFDIDDPAPIGRQGVAEGYKNTYNVGDRVDGPLGTGTIVAVSKNVNVDGRVRVKLDDPSKAGEDGKYKDSFVLTTTQLKHISEQGVAEGSDQNYQVGDQVLTQVGGRWIPAVITKPINAAGNYGVKFKVGSKVMNYVSSPDQLKKQRVAEGSVSTISKCASLAAKYFNSAGLQQQYDIDEYIKNNAGTTPIVNKCASLAAKYFNSAGLQQQYDIDEYIKANSEQGVAEGSEIKIPTEDGIGWQDIRLLAGEGKLTQKTIKQAIEIIRKQRKQKQGVAEGSDNSVEALIQMYNNRDQKIVKTKVFRSEDEANRWADRNNATILKLKDVAKKSTLDETSAGSIAGVVNPKIKNKSKVGTLFGGTYKQQKDK